MFLSPFSLIAKTFLLATLLLLSFSAHAAYTGTLEIRNWEHPDQTARFPLMKAKYTISSLMGEPTEHYVFYYESLDDFTKITGIHLSAQVAVNGTPIDAYIHFNPLVEEPGQPGWDVTGSPNWDSWMKSESGTFLSRERVRNIFKDGFSLTNMEVIEIDISQSTTFDKEYDAMRKYMISAIVEDAPQDFDRSSKINQASGLLPFNWYGVSNNNFWSERQISYKEHGSKQVTVSEQDNSRVCSPFIKHQKWRYAGYQYVALRYQGCSGGENLKPARIKIHINAFQNIAEPGAFGLKFEKRKLVTTLKHSAFYRTGQEIFLIDKIADTKEPKASPLFDYEFSIFFDEQGEKEKKEKSKELFRKISQLGTISKSGEKSGPKDSWNVLEDVQEMQQKHPDFAEGDLSNDELIELEKTWAAKYKLKEQQLVADAKEKVEQENKQFISDVEDKKNQEAKRIAGLDRLYVVISVGRWGWSPKVSELESKMRKFVVYDGKLLNPKCSDISGKEAVRQCKRNNCPQGYHALSNKLHDRCQRDYANNYNNLRRQRDRVKNEFKSQQSRLKAVVNNAVAGVFEIRFDINKVKISDLELIRRAGDVSWRLVEGTLLPSGCGGCYESDAFKLKYSSDTQVFTTKAEAQSYLNQKRSDGFQLTSRGSSHELTKLNAYDYTYVNEDKKR